MNGLTELSRGNNITNRASLKLSLLPEISRGEPFTLRPPVTTLLLGLPYLPDRDNSGPRVNGLGLEGRVNVPRMYGHLAGGREVRPYRPRQLASCEQDLRLVCTGVAIRIQACTGNKNRSSYKQNRKHPRWIFRTRNFATNPDLDIELALFNAGYTSL